MFVTPAEALHEMDANREAQLEKNIMLEEQEEAVRYLEFLDSCGLLRVAARDDAREKRLLTDVAEGTAREWAVAYAEFARSAKELRSFVVNLYAVDRFPAFDVSELIG